MSVWPLFGPEAGGTRITFIGQFLSPFTVKAVYIGHYKLSPSLDRLSSQILAIFYMIVRA